ncbi:MAG TPA: PAS domain-containing protein [Aggregatilinea sp.]|uniref:PAS domain-containing protein n=1 Tax=Aggregatilinea sp. TaxID=2806333 RepID=UPI002C8F6A6E|nr:PAS domain-containing protein [Aggregatilinea sp.]HML24314.1 PAS domain-containing protein [Aggregatilinea sp.]
MSGTQRKSLWELLWDYDPNGLIVLDKDMNVQIVNPAFCRMFGVEADAILDQPAKQILDDVDEFRRAWQRNEVVPSREHHYAQHGLYVRKVLFPIRDQQIIACIMVDLTHEQQQREELQRLKRETVKQINEVVDNQMKVAQEIAGLLGETTAETKVSMLKLLQMIEQGTV